MLPRYRWSDEAVMKFVNLYKNEPVLWNVTHDSYKSKAARFAALGRMATTMQMEDFGVNECRYKIKNIRTHYCQELGKIRNSSMSATIPEEVYRPTLVWFSTMDSFLRPFVTQGGVFDNNMKRKRFKSEVPDTVEYVHYGDTQQWDNGEGQEMVDHSAGEEIEGNSISQEIENNSPLQESEDNSYSQALDDSGYGQEVESHTFNQENVTQPSRIMIPRKRKSVNTTVYVDQGIHDYEQFSDVRTSMRETEFDLWCKSLAVQLNAMEITRALELQLKIQTLVSEERLAYERNKGNARASSVPDSNQGDQLSSQQQPM